ncbi:MAG: hypothetical protein ACOYD4_05350 [Solirubrobacterales bacterium]
MVAAIGGGGDHRSGVARLTSAGELDASFAGDGTIGPRASERAAALALAPGGKIVVAQEFGDGRPILRRFLPDGRLDRSFGRRGTTPIPVVPKNRLLAQPDGHVIALVQQTCPSWSCGYRFSYLEILRYDRGGELASKYTRYGESWEFEAAGIDARGYFVVVGGDEDLGFTTFARFRPRGGIDPSLGGPEGLEIEEPRYGEPPQPGDEVVSKASALAIQPDGGFVLAIDSGGTALTRRHRDGSLDAGFGDGGEAVCARGAVQEGPTELFDALAAAPDGSVLAAGGRGACGLVRYLPAGEPDPAFGDAGHVDLEALGLPRPLALALAPGGEIVLAGWDARTRSVEFARLSADGQLDPAFGSGGVTALAGF